MLRKKKKKGWGAPRVQGLADNPEDSDSQTEKEEWDPRRKTTGRHLYDIVFM